MGFSLLIIAWIVMWFSLKPDSAGKWFFKAQKAYTDLKGQQHDN